MIETAEIDAGESELRLRSLSFERRIAYERARREWSGIELSFERFEAHLLALGYTSRMPREASSLYLCLGCATGSPAACAALELRYFDTLRAALYRMNRGPADDILQQIRGRLLVGPEPKIGSYRGDGSLAAWLRSVALNAGRDYVRASYLARARHRALVTVIDAPDLGLRTRLEMPDELAFRDRHAQACKQALSSAMLALPLEQRRLLYNHHVLGLGIDTLGKMYGVNRATAARRIQRALHAVQQRLWKELALRFIKLDRRELGEIMRSMAEHMQCSATELLVLEASPPRQEAISSL